MTPRITIASPGRTSSGGSAFSTGLASALRRRLGQAEVAETMLPVAGRIQLPPEVDRAHTIVFLGSRALRVPTSTTIFWPLNVAPFERHASQARESSLRNRARHVALLHRLGRAVEAADGLVFGSHHARSLYQSFYRGAAAKPYAINRGGSPSGLRRLPRRTSANPLVLLVSHLYPYKGILQFVEAVNQCIGSLPKDVRFRVAGADRDVAYAREVRRRVSEYGLGNRLVIAPADATDMAILYAEATIAVFASTCENAGSFALYDGLHAGVPTLCSDRSSMPEMVGEHVRLFNPFQPSNLAQEITKLILDSQARDELAQQAETWSLNAPTWDDRADWLLNFAASLERK